VAVDEPAATVLVPAGVLTFTVAGDAFKVPPVGGADWVGEVDMTVGLGAGVLILGELETTFAAGDGVALAAEEPEETVLLPAGVLTT
jgi:hypothetical protein